MPTAPFDARPLPRLLSLDVFRGVTIAAMILVNKQGSSREGYAALQHVTWHGATPTDWIFPFFLFILGVALPFSIANRRARGASDAEILRHALVRGAILFALGVFEKNFPFTGMDLETFRIPGVLQRIALCYVAATVLLLRTTLRTQGVVAVVLLIAYWILLTFVPVPGAGVVALTRENAALNWPAWIDQITMGRHLGYGNYTWDANGLLSSVPSLVSTLLGVLTAGLLRSGLGLGVVARRMVIIGVVTTVAGWAWGGFPPLIGLAIVGEPTLSAAVFFPINKLLWTSSYVLYTAGLAMVALAACVWLVDLRADRRGVAGAGTVPAWAQPFLWLGTNAIFAYIVSGLVAKLLYVLTVSDSSGQRQTWHAWIQTHLFASWVPDAALASLLFSVFYAAVWIAITGLMYRRRVFVKL